MEINVKEIAAMLFDRARDTDGVHTFKPSDLMTVHEIAEWHSYNTAIGYQFYVIYNRNTDVLKRTAPGTYLRIGGDKLIMKGGGKRMVMEF